MFWGGCSGEDAGGYQKMDDSESDCSTSNVRDHHGYYYSCISDLNYSYSCTGTQ